MRDDKQPVSPAPLSAAVDALVSALLLAGIACAFSACCPAQGVPLFLAASLATSGALCIVSAFDGAGSRTRFAAVGIVVAAAAGAAVSLASFRAGLVEFSNQVITRFDNVFCAYVALLPAGAGEVSGTAFYLVAGAAAGVAVQRLVGRRRVLGATALAAVLGAASVCLHAGAPVLSLVLGGVGWVALWHVSSSGRRSSPVSVLAVCACCAVLLGFSLSLVGAYQPSAAVAGLREAVVAGADFVRFGDDTLPEGDLAEASRMGGDDERLLLSFDRVPQAEVDLRGFVGAVYEDGAWKPLDHTAYEGAWAGMYPWLSGQGLDPATQRAALDDASAANGEAAPEVCSVAVEATGADHAYAYVPYSLRSLEGVSIVDGRDGSRLASGAFGARSYRMELDDVDAAAGFQDAPAWLREASALQEEGYAAAESVYRSFVHEQYLVLDDEDRAVVERLFFDDLTWDADKATFYATVSRVRAMLATLASYTEEPAPMPASAGGSFVSWFLEDAREGNSAYFATAAVMAFRSQGIPARYAEGYRASAEDLAQLRAAGEYDLMLTSDDAHAWVEVYRDGLGWVPIDASPGFYDQPYAVQDVIEVNQAMAGEGAADAEAAGALGGDLPPADDAPAGGVVVRIVAAVVAFLLLVAAASALAAAFLEGTRSARRRRRAQRRAAEDQDVAVRALFDQLCLVVRAAGIGVDEGRPLECAARIPVAFEGVARAEYERIIALMQRSCFGGKRLREHEMRAIRRFVERLESGLPEPRTMRARFRRRYRDAL